MWYIVYLIYSWYLLNLLILIDWFYWYRHFCKPINWQLFLYLLIDCNLRCLIIQGNTLENIFSKSFNQTKCAFMSFHAKWSDLHFYHMHPTHLPYYLVSSFSYTHTLNIRFCTRAPYMNLAVLFTQCLLYRCTEEEICNRDRCRI